MWRRCPTVRPNPPLWSRSLRLYATRQKAIGRVAGVRSPQPVLVIRAEAVSMSALQPFIADERVEAVVVDKLTADTVGLANGLAGLLLVVADDPLSALTAAVIGGVRVPIVVALPQSIGSHCEDIRAAGAAAVVAIPFTRADVNRSIRALGKRSASVRVDVTMRLLLDPIGRTARRGDRAIRLTQREFALLHFLSIADGRAVATDALYGSVWGADSGLRNHRQLVAVFVRQLRVKLAALDLRHSIDTVRNYGYRLVAPEQLRG